MHQVLFHMIYVSYILKFHPDTGEHNVLGSGFFSSFVLFFCLGKIQMKTFNLFLSVKLRRLNEKKTHHFVD